MNSSSTGDHQNLRRTYPQKLRRGQALRLCRTLGYSEHSFRALVTSGRVTKQHIAGMRAHYDREQILTLLTQS